MDPLSIIAAVTGILAAAAKITNSLTAFLDREQKAPKTARSIVAEVTELRICLAQLSPFLQNTEAVPRSRRAAISVESVVVISTSCVMNLSELEKLLDSFKLNEPLSKITKLRWARQEQKINTLVSRIRESWNSLNLILTIVTCEVIVDVQGSVEKLATSIDSILQSSEDVARRLANTELSRARANKDATLSIPFLSGLTDTASEITIKPSAVPYDQPISPSLENFHLGLDPDLQSEINSSRVYVRNRQRHSISSVSSSSQFDASWSVLSGLSVSQISTVSVITLPISLGELWNPLHYSDSAPVVKQTSSEPLRSEGLLLKSRRYNERKIRDDLFNLRFRPRLQLSISKAPLNKQSLGLHDEEKLGAKILITGADGGGKTTLLNQMRLVHGYPFSLDEREEARKIVFTNVLVTFAIIFEEMRRLGLAYQNLEFEKRYERVLYGVKKHFDESIDLSPDDYLMSECLLSMQALWLDKAIQTAILQSGGFALHDNFQYYLENLDRLLSKGYLPTNQDILHARLKTAEATETLLYSNQTEYHVFDASGARSNQKKCIHTFINVDCLVFVAAPKALDSRLVEDQAINQLSEAEKLFQFIESLPWFREVPIFVFLNKIDLLREKLECKHVLNDFPNDVEEAKALYAQRFHDMAKGRAQQNRIHVYHTNATNTESLQCILNEVFRVATQHAKDIKSLKCHHAPEGGWI